MGKWYSVQAAQVVRIAASCPALQRLALYKVTSKDFDRSRMLQLPAGLTIWMHPAECVEQTSVL